MSLNGIRKRKDFLFVILIFGILVVGVLKPKAVLAQERKGLLINAGIAAKHDSNITRTKEELSDTVGVFSPKIRYLNSFGKHNFVMDYQGEYASYADNSSYNYNAHNIKIGALFDHSYRLSSEFQLGYQKKVEEPGVTNAEVQINDGFNEFTNKSGLARIYYGSNTSTGQLIFDLSQEQQRYTNNNQEYRDVDKDSFTGTFFYRVSPKTRFLLEGGVASYDYVSKNKTRDQSSNENLILTGVEWRATEITSGIIKVGYQSKEFDDKQFSDVEGLSYFFDFSWKPNTYTEVKLAANRRPVESAQQDVSGYIKTGYSIGIEHAITARTILVAGYQHDTSDVGAAIKRTDVRKRVNLGISHSLRNWLDIGLSYKYLRKSSDDELFSFTSNIVELSLTTRFE